MRTRHVVDGKPKYTNALAKETSPYLLQHAHNPVAWRAWSAASLDEAKQADKPIFLSIGYSTCHWCHVMEEESFEDEEVAAAINAAFIPIKVDREERPDVDGIYMTAVQALTGHGGWPMTVFITPDGKPFFAGTYFPARDGDRGTRLGFLSIVKRLEDAWKNEREKVLGSANEIAGELASLMKAPAPTDMPPREVIDHAVRFTKQRYDDVWGGYVPAPKFPSSLPIRVLLRHHARTGDKDALSMAAHSFRKMSDGGMYDQIGGGFHRYSTDEKWLVPHFEKMLYDNALLVMSGLELWQVTKDARVEFVVRDVLRYVERDMTSPRGAFYSATDADSLSPSGEREEGWYFTWTRGEMADELRAHDFSDADVEAVCDAWGVTPRGNFEGRSIPWRAPPSSRAIAAIDPRVDALLEKARPILLAARNERPLPLRDDKILAAWNGLMISAFARAGFVLDEPHYVDVAARAASFVLDNMRTPDGRLFRTCKDAAPSTAATTGATEGGTSPAASAKNAGILDDHAFVLQALVDVFEALGFDGASGATGPGGANGKSDAKAGHGNAAAAVRTGGDFLDAARALERAVAVHFEDITKGGFFLTADDAEKLLAREKPAHDGAEPSGNSVHALNLARLAAIFDDANLKARAERTVCAFGQILGRHPGALMEMLLAVDFLHATPKEIVVVDAATRDGADVLAPVRSTFLGNRVIVRASSASSSSSRSSSSPSPSSSSSSSSSSPSAKARTPLLEGRAALDGKTTVYVCEQRACKLPATNAADVERALT